MDVIKERLQIEGQLKTTQPYSGSVDALRRIVAHEGVWGLYRAFPIHQLTWAPFNGCYFMAYEKLKSLCVDAGYADENDRLEGTAQLCCGTAAGVFAGSVTNPMDV